jgi:hypothetical protein
MSHNGYTFFLKAAVIVTGVSVYVLYLQVIKHVEVLADVYVRPISMMLSTLPSKNLCLLGIGSGLTERNHARQRVKSHLHI